MRSLVLALAVIAIPAAVTAQLEVGVDVVGLTYSDVDGAQDAEIGVSLPISGVRVAFPAGERLRVETRMDVEWGKQGDSSGSSITLLPGANFLVNEQVYVRGEVGLFRLAGGNATSSASGTQYLFGGAIGMRRPLGMGILRLEAGALKGVENLDGDIQFAGRLDVHVSAGVSVVVN